MINRDRGLVLGGKGSVAEEKALPQRVFSGRKGNTFTAVMPQRVWSAIGYWYVAIHGI